MNGVEEEAAVRRKIGQQRDTGNTMNHLLDVIADAAQVVERILVAVRIVIGSVNNVNGDAQRRESLKHAAKTTGLEGVNSQGLVYSGRVTCEHPLVVRGIGGAAFASHPVDGLPQL